MATPKTSYLSIQNVFSNFTNFGTTHAVTFSSQKFFFYLSTFVDQSEPFGVVSADVNVNVKVVPAVVKEGTSH